MDNVHFYFPFFVHLNIDFYNRHSPFELSQLLLDSKIHEILHLKAINPDEVNLTPELLK